MKGATDKKDAGATKAVKKVEKVKRLNRAPVRYDSGLNNSDCG